METNDTNNQVSHYSVNITGNASGVQIQQNTSHSAQRQKINDNFNYNEVSKILEEISKYESLFSEVFGQTAEQAKSALNNAKYATSNKENPSKVKNFLNILKDLSLKVSSSVIAKGIVELISKLSV